MSANYEDRISGVTSPGSGYLDNFDSRYAATNLAIKAPCRVATTANITLSGEQTIDGVAVTANQRVLVKDQTTASQNGIYDVSTSTWSRSVDFDGSRDIVTGTLIKVNEGTLNQGFWYISTSNPITIGTTSLSIARASSVLANVSAFMQTVLDDADAATARTTLGVTAATGTNAGLAEIATQTETNTGTDDTRIVSPFTLQNKPLSAPSITGLTAETVLDGAADYVAVYDASATANRKVLLNDLPSKGFKNALINGCFRINQRAAASNADDTYAHDRWYVLTQTGTIAVSTLTDVENGLPHMARLTQSQAVAQRMGYAQIIEGVNCKQYRGKTVTFRFGRERLSTSANIRIAVLEWTGTEDTVTSDVVLDWTSASYTAGGFFLAANLTVSAVVQQALTAATLTDGSSVTVTLGSGFNNLIVFAWSESTLAQNATLDFGFAQIELGASATQFEHRPIAIEQSLCERYLPALAAMSVGNFAFGGTGQCISTTQAGIPVPFRQRARTAPAGISISNATHFAITNSAATLITSTNVVYNSSSQDMGIVTVTVAAGLTAGNATLLYSNNVAAKILFTGAEL